MTPLREAGYQLFLAVGDLDPFSGYCFEPIDSAHEAPGGRSYLIGVPRR